MNYRRYSIDLYAAVCYPGIAKRVLDTFPEITFGILIQDFGPVEDGLKLCEYALSTNHDIWVRADWEDDHTWEDRQFNGVLAVCKLVNDLAIKYPGRKVFLAPLLEHRVRGERARKFFKRVRAIAPHCIIVNSGPAPMPGYVTEVHGKGSTLKSQYLYSADGWDLISELNPRQMLAKHRRALRFGIWRWRYNRRKNRHDTTPRKDRKITPTYEEICSDIRRVVH